MRLKLENAPVGLAISARLVDGDEVLPGLVSVSPMLDSNGDPLDAYVANFTPPAALPVQLEWIEDQGLPTERVVVSEIVDGEPSVSSGSPPDPAGVADYVKRWLGGDNWDVLVSDLSFGSSYVALATEAIKRRVMTAPVVVELEPSLDGRLLDYLGLLTALDLLSALRSAWASRIISKSIGNDPVEIETYTDRARQIDSLREDLMLRLVTVQAAALPLLDQPIVGIGSRPMIDEVDDLRVLDDPRSFPPASTFPFPRYSWPC